MAARVQCRCGWTKVYSTRERAEFNARRHVCRTAKRVRRGTYSRRCARCFWTGEYDTAAKADYAKKKHSCQKHEMAMLRAAMREERLALIDRTPKSCLHKVANHVHGTHACYVLDKCRCRPCADAHAAYERNLTRQKAYGRYNKWVAAEHVRAHLAELKEYGIGLKRVSELSGVSNGSLTKIWYGKYADTGRQAEPLREGGTLVRGPARRVLRKTAEAIFDVEPIPANLGARVPDHERTPLARTHLRALVALGWSMSELGVRLGMKPEHRGNACALITGDRVMARETVDRAEALFEQLSMTLPPETNQRERQAAARSRNYAAAHGWLPPLALDDLAPYSDDSDDLDEAAIERRLNGDKTIRLRKGESAEVVRRALARGISTTQIERDLGIKTERYVRLGEAS